jgi:hypothetical protein
LAARTAEQANAPFRCTADDALDAVGRQAAELPGSQPAPLPIDRLVERSTAAGAPSFDRYGYLQGLKVFKVFFFPLK